MSQADSTHSTHSLEHLAAEVDRRQAAADEALAALVTCQPGCLRAAQAKATVLIRRALIAGDFNAIREIAEAVEEWKPGVDVVPMTEAPCLGLVAS